MDNIQKALITKTEMFLKETLKNRESGHGIHHLERVRNVSVKIAQHHPQANMFLINLIALLHDLDDHKFVETKKVPSYLESLEIPEEQKTFIQTQIDGLGFKSESTLSLEGQIVSDADQIDALGAIGIARCFNYGGFKNRVLYDPEIKPKTFETQEEYRNSVGTTVNHFYEKLLLLKDKIYTKEGKEIAQQRHDFMVAYLDQFMMEWHDK